MLTLMIHCVRSTSASTLFSMRTSAFSTVTPIGCPVEILSTIEIFASQRRHDSVFSDHTTNFTSLEEALHQMRSYDLASWAMDNTTESSKVSSQDLMRLGTIWQLSADISACRILACLAGYTFTSESLQVQNLIAEYAFLERDDDGLIKCLIWLTFIAGAASTTYEARAWVLKTLDRIWSWALCQHQKFCQGFGETVGETRPGERQSLVNTCHFSWVSVLGR